MSMDLFAHVQATYDMQVVVGRLRGSDDGGARAI